MIWNATENELTIEWLEDKRERTEFHTLSRKPLRLQLHPTTGQVLRAYIKGARPAWIVKYAKDKKIRTHETTTAEGKGWWIANWNNYTHDDRPLLCPFIKGMIEEWFEKLPSECEDDKERLLRNIEAVEINLMYHYKEFEQWGLFFRPEEILMDGGALLVEPRLRPSHDEEGEWDISKWPDYNKVIVELQELRDIPEELLGKARIDDEEEESFVLELPSEAPAIAVETEEELTFDEESSPVSLMDSIEEDAVPLDFSEVGEQELLTLEDNAETLREIEVEEELVLIAEEEMELSVTSEETFVVVQGLLNETNPEESVSKELICESSEEETLMVNIPTITEPHTQKAMPSTQKVAERRSKKEGIVVGQTLLF